MRTIKSCHAIPEASEKSGYLHQLYADARLLLRIDTVLEQREIDADIRKERAQKNSWAINGKTALSIVTVVTLSYLFLEMTWVLSLFDIITDKTTNQGDIRRIETAGRCLAAFGLTWFFAKSRFLFFKQGIGHFAFDSVILIVGTSAMFYIIGIGYDVLINSFSKQSSMQFFEVSAARKWVLDGKLKLDKLDATDPISMSLFPLLILDEKAKEIIHSKYQHERSVGATDAIDSLLKAYPDIQSAKTISQTLQNKYSDFIKQSKEIERTKAFVSSADKKWYVSSSNAKQIQNGALEKVFIDNYGQAPNAHASFEEFVAGLKNSKYDDLKRAGQAIEKAGGDAQKIKLVDLPGLTINLSQVISMNKAEYEAFLRDQFRQLIDETLPTEDTIKASKIGRDGVSAVIIPPVAIVLSLLSVIINVTSLAGHLIAFAFRGGPASSKETSGIWHLVLPVVALLLIGIFVDGRAPAGFEKAFDVFSVDHPIAAFVLSKVVAIDSFLLQFF